MSRTGDDVVADGGSLTLLEGADDSRLVRAAATHAMIHDPARVLRQVAAMRSRLVRHSPSGSTSQPTGCMFCGRYGEFVAWPCPDVLDDMAVYGVPVDGSPCGFGF